MSHTFPPPRFLFRERLFFWVRCRVISIAGVLTLVVLLLPGDTCWAGQTLRGTVRDARTLLPVPYALVELLNFGMQTETDARGRFMFESIPYGEFRLCIHRLGYEDRCDATIRVGSEEFVVPVVYLEPRPIESEEIVVQGRVPDRLPVGAVTVITAEDIKRSGAHTASEVLINVPEVEILSSGSGVTQVSIRGSKPEGVRVLVDGVPLNFDGGSVDLSSIPAQNIEKIEIIRGPAVAYAGVDALAGAILITSRAIESQPRVEVSVATGSFEKQSTSARLQGIGIGTHRASVSFQRDFNRGDFNYVDPDLGPATRLNNDSDRRSVGIRGRGLWSPSVGWKAHASYYKYDSGGPGLEKSPTPGARKVGDRWTLSGELNARGFSFFSLYSQDYSRYDNDSPISNHTRYQSSSRTWRASYEPQSGMFRGGGAMLEFLRENQSGEDLKIPAYSYGATGRQNYAASVHFAGHRKLGSGAIRSLRWSAAYRYDQTETDAQYPTGILSPKIESPVKVWKFGSPHVSMGLAGDRGRWGWSVDVSAARGFRRPPLYDQFVFAGPIRGNPGLRPEQSGQVEAGYALSRDGRVSIQFEQRYFWTEFKDLIGWQIGRGDTWSPYNISGADVAGRDESIRVTLPHLQFRVTHLYQDHRDASGEATRHGQPLPGRYRHKVSLGATASWSWGWCTLSHREFDRRYIRPSGGKITKWIEPYGVTDLVAGIEGIVPGQDSRISFGINNIGDRRYHVVERDPMPGRNYTLTLHFGTTTQLERKTLP